MVEIIPAIMPRSFKEIEEKTSAVSGLVKTVQIDVMDGIFVPDKSWPYEGDDRSIFEKLKTGEVPMPHWRDVDFEIDLMVKEPYNAIASWLSVGAARIIIHLESASELDKIVEEYDLSDVCELGLALDIRTPNEAIYPWISKFKFIQFMGIEEIGFQGEPFSPKVIPKIKDLRECFPEAIISVDGGVNLENAFSIIDAGANRLVSGSAIWKSGYVKEAIEKFKNADLRG